MAFDYTKQNEAFWKKHLPKETFLVCRLKGTEQAGTGKYNQFYEKGIYYCAGCGGDYALYSKATGCRVIN